MSKLTSVNELNRLLDVIEYSVVPLTRTEGVAKGNKLFGAAVLRKSDLSLVVAATNTETTNPLFHGEITAINKFYAIPKTQRPDPKECVFVATHEPCSLCLSGITWGGFDNFYYLFTYEDSRDAFKTPFDIDILQTVYQTGGPDTELYNRHNKFFDGYAIKELINATGHEPLHNRVAHLKVVYDELSEIYQKGKTEKRIPFD